MSIVLVRHGETAGNASRVLQPADIPLNELGKLQAERLAERLATMPIGHIVSSDLRRAQMTAGPIAERLGLAIETTPLLAERNFGDLRGTAYADLGGDPFAPGFAPPNGETWDMFHERVERAFEFILTRAADTSGELLVVTHGLVCRALLTRHIAPSAGEELPSAFGNCGVTLLDPTPPYQPRLVNCVRHLDGIGDSGRALTAV